MGLTTPLLSEAALVKLNCESRAMCEHEQSLFSFLTAYLTASKAVSSMQASYVTTSFGHETILKLIIHMNALIDQRLRAIDDKRNCFNWNGLSGRVIFRPDPSMHTSMIPLCSFISEEVIGSKVVWTWTHRLHQ